MKNLNYLTVSEWSNGATIFVALIGLLILAGLVVVLGYFFLKERKRRSEEKATYISGVLSKSEMSSTISNYIQKNIFHQAFFLILVDIDKFSQVINIFGDKIAKNVLVTIVDEIEKLLPFQVQIGRLAQDEFLIFFRAEYNFTDVSDVANNIKNIFKNPIKISYDIEVAVTASIGIVQYPIHGQTYQDLLDSLNLAIYNAKRKGGDTIELYYDELRYADSDNVQYYEKVKEAIHNKEFVLFYQPMVDFKTKKVVYAESLLRWENKKLGLLKPNEFMHILEQSGDIYWIGLWGLEEAIREYLAVKDQFPTLEFKIDVNLSLKQLANEKLSTDFQKVIRKYKVSADNIVIELEEFIMHDSQSIIHANIMKLKELGFRLVVDGYAFDHKSLLRLNDLPIDMIKLDAHFLEGEDKEVMIHVTDLIMAFARKKGINIVAERIEDPELIKYFMDQDITIMQGFLLSKPMSGEDLISYIADSSSLEARINAILNGEKVEEAPEEKLNRKPEEVVEEAPAEETKPEEEQPQEEAKVEAEEPQKEEEKAQIIDATAEEK